MDQAFRLLKWWWGWNWSLFYFSYSLCIKLCYSKGFTSLLLSAADIKVKDFLDIHCADPSLHLASLTLKNLAALSSIKKYINLQDNWGRWQVVLQQSVSTEESLMPFLYVGKHPKAQTPHIPPPWWLQSKDKSEFLYLVMQKVKCKQTASLLKQTWVNVVLDLLCGSLGAAEINKT